MSNISSIVSVKPTSESSRDLARGVLRTAVAHSLRLGRIAVLQFVASRRGHPSVELNRLPLGQAAETRMPLACFGNCNTNHAPNILYLQRNSEDLQAWARVTLNLILPALVVNASDSLAQVRFIHMKRVQDF